MEFNMNLFLWTGLNWFLLFLIISLPVWVVFKVRSMGKDLEEIKRRFDK